MAQNSFSQPGVSELSDLELSGDGFREMLQLAGERVAEHLDGLGEQPSWSTEGWGTADFERLLSEFDWKIDGKPTEFQSLLKFLFELAIPCSFNTASPGYLAYIPGGGLPQTAIADLIAAATNRYVGVRAAAPCLAAIEQDVIDWLCRLFGLPAGSGGILTSGGSLANWTAIVTARTKLLGEEFLDGVLYCSEQTHHCVEKAARLCGIKKNNIRKIGVDDQFRIRVGDLVEAIGNDKKAGRRPFFLAANAGTTNTGAVDPLPELSNVCRESGLWFHVDAAYGGFFMLTEPGRRVLSGISRADSLVVDPHKGMFLPYGSGVLLVKDVRDLSETHRLDADYLPPRGAEAGVSDFHEISPELSREFRGLRMWLPLKMHGVEPFRNNLVEKLALTNWIYDRLVKWQGSQTQIEIIADPQLSVFAFRVRWIGESGSPGPVALDKWNEELLVRVNARKRVYLTSTILNGQFAIRICVLSFRTHQEQLQHCFDDLTTEILKLEQEIGAPAPN